MTPPARHWRSYGNDPLPSGAEALDQPFAAFPSWFLRITCDRCGKDRMVNETHAPWRDRTLRQILARMRHDGCGGLAGKAELLTGIEAASSRPVRRIVLISNPISGPPSSDDAECTLRSAMRMGLGRACIGSIQLPRAMTRSELIAQLAASNPHLRQADVELIVLTVFDQISSALARGQRVELRGFGAFTVKRRNARVGRNPRSGEEVSVGEKMLPFFKAGRELRQRLNRPARR